MTRHEHQGFKDQLDAFINKRPDYFDTTEMIHCGSAPGRLDVMGGIADYSGSLVLELPINNTTTVALQPRKDRSLFVYSENGQREARLSLADLSGSLDQVATFFRQRPDIHWASYCVGALPVLRESHKVLLEKGLSMYINSDVPEGKGVSSSAALEAACMRALCACLELALDNLEMAFLCQKVENLVAGAPCGIMDQVTSLLGQPNAVLPIVCQPCEIKSPIPLPEDVAFWGLDSGIRHAVGGSDYAAVRAGAFMGYRIIAEHVGLSVTRNGPGQVVIDDPEWNGYLANIPLKQFEDSIIDYLPDTMTGKEFLERYDGVSDPLSLIEPIREYAIKQPTAHPVYEHHRTRTFLNMLENKPGHDARIHMGQLMLESHRSYSRCGLGSDGTDRLVELAMQAGPEKGVYGAKISGGGSGGTVVVMAKKKTETLLKEIQTHYTKEKERENGALISGIVSVDSAEPASTFNSHRPC